MVSPPRPTTRTRRTPSSSVARRRPLVHPAGARRASPPSRRPLSRRPADCRQARRPTSPSSRCPATSLPPFPPPSHPPSHPTPPPPPQWKVREFIAANSSLMFDPKTGMQGGEAWRRPASGGLRACSRRDSAREWYFDKRSRKLYYNPNSTTAGPTGDEAGRGAHARADQRHRHDGGAGARVPSRPLAPRRALHVHGPARQPSGGDWALQRSGAILIRDRGAPSPTTLPTSTATASPSTVTPRTRSRPRLEPAHCWRDHAPRPHSSHRPPNHTRPPRRGTSTATTSLIGTGDHDVGHTGTCSTPTAAQAAVQVGPDGRGGEHRPHDHLGNLVRELQHLANNRPSTSAVAAFDARRQRPL